MDKLILDTRAQHHATALKLYYDLVPNNPDQQVGKEHAIQQEIQGVLFSLIRNDGSYTVKEIMNVR